MQVVVEEAMFVGVVMGWLILKFSAKVCHQKGRLFLLSALVGEVVSLFMPLFKMHFLLRGLLAVLTGLLMLCISFEVKSFKNFILLFGAITTATFIFGGACEALKSLIGTFPLFVVAFVGVVVYFATLFILRASGRRGRREGFVYKVKIKDGGKLIEEEGYLDSGNVLYDCISGQPISLVTFKVFSQLYGISLGKFLAKEVDLCSIKNGHYIKINSVGSGAKMLVFSVDEVEVGGGKVFENAMLGLSFSKFEKSFGRQILLHCDMV
ncbi:MAG: sigma-E processing peptidase SpoIIGA [Clostridia bacterium]|nr:sigma-E processing peptidase SpoIIGA [Clostridia bacterium]